MSPKKPIKKSPVKKPEAKKPARKKHLRENINVLAIIEALESHVLGATEMTPTQVSAALALLKKTLPDMTDPAKLAGAIVEADTRHEDALKDLE